VAFRATGVTVRYGGVLAVDDVSLDVRSGETVGLIGPNGAGKTSFIDAVSGFTTRAEGTVYLSGETLQGVKPHGRARRGLIRTFQQLELFTDLTVRENIGVACRSVTGRQHSDEIERVIALLELQDDADRRVSELPSGRRHVAALARAAACSPRVLLLDEPAAGLDTEESVHLGEFITALAGSGVAILLVDHDMSLVLSVCDRITVLNFGRVLASGTPAEIRRDEAVLRAYLGEA